jgi:chromosomal replication initiation ATPase DnaA
MAQLVFDMPFRAAIGREDFWVSPSNERAVAWVDRWPEWPTPVLILYGPAAAGKSHLLQVWKARSNGWTVDDVDRLIGDRDKEEELFHRYNRLKEDGQTALMTAQTPPSQWNFVIPDLRSRLVAQSAVEIDLPDDGLLRALIVKHLSDRQLSTSPEVVNYILMRVERSFSAVQDVIGKADKLALSRKKPITVPLLREALGD